MTTATDGRWADPNRPPIDWGDEIPVPLTRTENGWTAEIAVLHPGEAMFVSNDNLTARLRRVRP